MTSLTEAYERNKREVTSPWRLYTGVVLVLVGGILGALAVLVVTTEYLSALASGTLPSREAAGTLGGLAVPVVLVGVFTVLPAGRRAQAGAAVSASICLLGVALFRHAYPAHWDGHGQDLTFFVSVVYLIGLFSAIWCLFVVVANFKMRNDPGGALEMTVTRQGTTEVVEVERDHGLSSVGFLGSTPDGEIETQTNGSEARGNGRAASAVAASTTRTDREAEATSGGRHPTSDGGSAVSGSAASAQTVERPSSDEPADHYCGNCRYYEYRRESAGMVPYCTRHGDRMTDMDPCEEWEPNW